MLRQLSQLAGISLLERMIQLIKLLNDTALDGKQLLQHPSWGIPHELFPVAVHEVVVKYRPKPIVHALLGQSFDVLDKRVRIVVQVGLVLPIEDGIVLQLVHRR